MKLFAAAVLMACSLSVAFACSCFPTTLKRDFFAPETDAVIKGRVLFSSAPSTSPDANRLFVIQTQVVYKGCNVPSFFVATSPVQSATCGITLSVGTSYILPLLDLNKPTLSLCQFIRAFDRLSTEDMEFLQTRQVCCDGRCECVDRPLVNCFRQPCSPPEQPPCDEAVQCVDNYCGGCFAEWFTEDGQYACLPSPFEF